MQVVRESAEHHFITTLEKIKPSPKGWWALYFALSKFTTHDDLILNPKAIKEKLGSAKQTAKGFQDNLLGKIHGFKTGYAYLFKDCDVVVLVKVENDQEKEALLKVYKEVGTTLKAGIADKGMLTHDLYNYQKLADRKLLSLKQFDAYEAMSDENKVKSIAIRRQRRENPLVLIVEDDRFTASYTSNILNKDYDLVVARSGEEGLEAYIEYAPDIMFLDIHLPGLSGHEVLSAIKAIDPKAFIVMLSVDTAKNNIMQASQTGAQNFLKKPFSKERLISTVKSSPYVRGLYQKVELEETDSVH